MFLQPENMEEIIVFDCKESQKIKGSKVKTDVAEEHNKWQKIREERKCKDFSNMSYWQMVSHCTIL